MTKKHHEAIKPYIQEADKKEQVAQMFDNIAPRYDLLNRMLSFGIDQTWRKKLAREVVRTDPGHVLDIATGTGDVAFQLVRQAQQLQVTGVDISREMLDLARQKAARRSTADRCTFLPGDAENLPFRDNTFGAVTVAFGVRNFENTTAGLTECLRVLRPGGVMAILEFSQPSALPFKQLYQMYFRHLLPLIGRITSGDARAYSYLFESVQAFPSGKDFVYLMKTAGYHNISFRPFTLGACTLYLGFK